MWTAFKQILSSKKVVLALVAGATAGVAKLGFAVDSETVALIVSPLIAAIVGQGIADHGKEAAKIEAAAKPPA
jgi:hypothetical protein